MFFFLFCFYFCGSKVNMYMQQCFGIMTGKIACDKHLGLVILLDFSLTVKAASCEFVFRTSQP